MIESKHPHGGLFVGILITVFGVIFLLDQLSVVHAAYVFQVFWPVVLIAVGLQAMVRTGRFPGNFWGPVLVLIGVIWLLNNFAITHIAVARLWPLWMIAFGVWLLMNADRRRNFPPGRRRDWRRYGPRRDDWWVDRGRAEQQSWTQQSWANPEAPSNAPIPPGPQSAGFGAAAPDAPSEPSPGAAGSAASSDDTFEHSVVFMAFKRRITTQHFRFAKLSAVFGGFHLDFTMAGMEGNQAIIQIDAAFGGGEIRIPPTWRVSIEAHAFGGAFMDETYARPDATAPAKVLIIRGSTVFGGVVIKN